MTEEGKSVTIDDNIEATAPATNQMKSVAEQTSYTMTDNINDVDKLALNKSNIEKCPNCSILRLHNQELEEALRKATTLSTADTLNSPAYVIPNGEFEIEFPMHYLDVQQYMAAQYKQGKSKVWFRCKIDLKSKKVTSAKTGRISVDIN